MTDSTHNTLVTMMIILAVLITIILLGRGFGGKVSFSTYQYQPASASNFYTVRDGTTERTPFYNQTVTAYSHPSRPTNFGSYSHTNTTEYTTYYDTTYTYGE